MLLDGLIGPDSYALAAFVLYLAGFLTRDELWLRGLVAAGTVFYVLFYFSVADTPLWTPIASNTVVLAINVLLIAVILRERTTFGMSAEMLALYERFPTLNPGQFRRVMSAAEICKAQEHEVLTRKGEGVPGLVLVVEGTVELKRQDKVTPIPAGNFIGEISFLVGGPASATVAAPPGTRYVFWDMERLNRMLEKSPALSNAFNALFNQDLARKLAVSAPE